MIQLLAVTQFVYNHIVTYLLRTEHKQAIEIQVTLRRARTPAALLSPDGNATAGNARNRGKLVHTTTYVLLGGYGNICEILISRSNDPASTSTFHGSLNIFEQQNKASLFDKADRKTERITPAQIILDFVKEGELGIVCQELILHRSRPALLHVACINGML